MAVTIAHTGSGRKPRQVEVQAGNSALESVCNYKMGPCLPTRQTLQRVPRAQKAPLSSLFRLPTAGAGRTTGVGAGQRPGAQPGLLPGLCAASVFPAFQGLRPLPTCLLLQLPRCGSPHRIRGDSPEKGLTVSRLAW